MPYLSVLDNLYSKKSALSPCLKAKQSHVPLGFEMQSRKSDLPLPTLWPLPPFRRGSVRPMVRAYFGAKKIVLVEGPFTHRGILTFKEWVQ